jgi:hypothetical protein
MDAIRTIPTGFENVQNVQNARAAEAVAPPRERERDGAQPQSLRPEQSNASVQVNLSETARAAARSDSPPASVSAPAAPVQTQEAVSRTAGSVESQNAASSSREAVQRYMENADNKLPAGQSGPSAVRVSA